MYGCYPEEVIVDDRDLTYYLSSLIEKQGDIDSSLAAIGQNEQCMCQTAYELIELLSEKGLLRSDPYFNTPSQWRIPDEYLAWITEANSIRLRYETLTLRISQIRDIENPKIQAEIDVLIRLLEDA